MKDISRLHRDAIIALLEPLTGPPTGYQIYSGKVTAPDSALTYPYLSVWSAPAVRQILNFTGNVSDATTTTQVTAFGRDEDEVLAALDRAAELLHGAQPIIPGRTCGFIRQLVPAPIVFPTDDVHTAGQPSYQGVTQYQLTSDAAAAA